MRRRITAIINISILVISIVLSIIASTQESFTYDFLTALLVAVLAIGLVYFTESIIYRKAWLWNLGLFLVLLGGIPLPFKMDWYAKAGTWTVLGITFIVILCMIGVRFALKIQTAESQADNRKPEYKSYHDRKAEAEAEAANNPAPAEEPPVFKPSKAMSNDSEKNE